HIDPIGNAALRTCLPAFVLNRVRETSCVNGDLVAAFTHRREQVTAQTFPPTPADEITHVDRDAFRQSLLTGLADNVRFGRTAAGYQTTGSGRVPILFVRGGYAEGGLLIGADGVGSVVRRQLLPHATVRDLGLRCLY